MMKFSSTMTIQYDTIFSPFTAAQYPEALDWLRDSGFDAAEVCISHYRDRRGRSRRSGPCWREIWRRWWITPGSSA